MTTVEVLGNERLDLGDTGGSTDEDNVVDLLTGHLGILEDLLNGVEGGLERSGVDLLETSTGDAGREVLTLKIYEQTNQTMDTQRLTWYKESTSTVV